MNLGYLLFLLFNIFVIIVIIIISFFLIFLFWEFFTQALADSFSLEFKWKQVSLSLQDSSLYLAFLFPSHPVPLPIL